MIKPLITFLLLGIIVRSAFVDFSKLFFIAPLSFFQLDYTSNLTLHLEMFFLPFVQSFLTIVVYVILFCH